MKPQTNKEIKIENYDIFTFRRIRRAIGYLGISLPLFLVGFSLIPFFQTQVQPSISHYYYTNLREIFTGTLCAVGLFLIRYKGHDNPSLWKNDNLLTNIAGVLALGVALFPTNPDDFANKIYTLIPYPEKWLGWLHYSFAALLFLILALLAINVFTIGQENETRTPKSILNENNIYRVSGYSIILFVVLVPVFELLKLFTYSTLVLEALSLFAFGLAWLVKGRALGDKGVIGQKLYQENNGVSTEKIFEE
ncbi:hypothetical protein BC749_1011386 [Flavobacterium araucananum]|uniref:DUF998 domain-containing protein n=1 Tax=Flavobacterium araucananum TaxID=946678 RepID=A0A227NSY2_9FLAO|nr:hypothetical protein [Flavobacterium araucananum]OXG00810.1 hypothetical protein B0A64_19495 [Flavobacterium araucananum]PWK03287.1 hypothetical protein BC749_1011386 [Flavobacterium araucananum]